MIIEIDLEIIPVNDNFHVTVVQARVHSVTCPPWVDGSVVSVRQESATADGRAHNGDPVGVQEAIVTCVNVGIGRIFSVVSSTYSTHLCVPHASLRIWR